MTNIKYQNVEALLRGNVEEHIKNFESLKPVESERNEYQTCIDSIYCTLISKLCNNDYSQRHMNSNLL